MMLVPILMQAAEESDPRTKELAMLLIGIGLIVMFLLALYHILAGKHKGPMCGCGSGECGRPINKTMHHDTEHRLSSDTAPEGTLTEDDAERLNKQAYDEDPTDRD
ncbi:MAG: hypothetical protein ACOCXX_04955 [Planctomycetota bacterium]